MPINPGSAIGTSTAPAPVALPTMWTETQESSANSSQTITKTAEVGRTHYAMSLEVSIKGGQAGGDIDIVLKDGATIIWAEVIGEGSKKGTRVGGNFTNPISGTVNTNMSLEIDAGGAGVVTIANLAGYTL